MKYKDLVIYADYDGTLTDRPSLLNEKNVSAIHTWIQEGGKFALSTGRNAAQILKLNAIETNAPSILQNGTVIGVLGEKPLLVLPLDQNKIRTIANDLYQRFPKLGIFFVTDDFVPVRMIEREHGKVVEEHPIQEVLDSLQGITISNMCIDSEFGDIDAAAEYVEKTYPGMHAIYSAPGHMDVIRKDVSKGSALEWIRSHVFNHGETLIAIGDNTNDMELLRHADYGLAMGNGTDEVKKIADGILKDCTYPCVLSAMEWIDQNRKR